MNYGTAIQVTGIEAVKARIAKVNNGLKNNETAFKRAVAVVDGWVQQNFRSEGGNVGGWAPLAESTLKQRKRGSYRHARTASEARRMDAKGPGKFKILQVNGTLRMKWKHLFGKDHGALVSAVDYGIFHEKGTSKMPQRRILPTMEEIWPKIKALFSDELRRSIHD